MQIKRQKRQDDARSGKHRRRLLSERLEPRVVMDASGFLDETIINDPVHGDQTTAAQQQSAALFDNGKGIIAYSGRGDGDNRGIFVRMVDHEGSPDGEAIRVNQTKGGTQRHASITTLADGTAIAVWSGRGIGDNFGVFARRIGVDGQFLSDEFKINQTTRGIQARPVITMLAGGEMVVAWSGKGAGDLAGVFFRKFDAGGNAQGDEVRVNDVRFGMQGSPQIAATADGGFAIAWSGTGEGDWAGVFLRRFDAGGNSTTSAIRINHTVGGPQSSPQLASLPGGELLVVWSGQGSGDSSGIFARTIDNNGQLSTGEVQVNVNTPGLQYGPTVAAAKDGSFLVLWNEFAGARGSSTVKGRHFQSISSPASDEFSLPITQSGQQYAPSVVSDGTGGYLALWTQEEKKKGDVYARRMPSPGGADTDPPIVTLRLTNDTGVLDSDAVTSDASIAATVADASAITSLALTVIGTTSETIDVMDFYDGTNGTVAIADADLRSRLTNVISDGQLSLRLSATDAVGNVSAPTQLNLTLDTTLPDQPMLQSIEDSSGQQVLGGSTSDTLLRFRGIAEPLSNLQLFDASVGSLGSTVVDAAGNWTIEVDLAPHATTNFSVTAQATDAAGNLSVLSNVGTVSVGVVLPQTPLILSVTDDTGASNQDLITFDTTLTVSGSGKPGDTVSLREATTGNLGQTVVTSTGGWTIDLTGNPFVDGTYSLQAIASDSSGNQSDPSVARTLVVDTSAPIIANVQLAVESDSGIRGDNRTDIPLVDVVGSTEPGAIVRWLFSGQEVSASSDGTFRLPSIPLLPGEVSYPLSVEDAAGNSSAQTLTLFLEASLSVSESIFDSQAMLTLPIPDNSVSPTLRFDIQPQFDTTATGFASEDVLGVYVVDANDPSNVLIARTNGNPSLLTIAGDSEDFDPSLVRFDGDSVEIDLSSVADVGAVGLVAQWINSDDDFGSTAHLTRIAIDDDSDGLANPAFDFHVPPIASGPAVDFNDYAVAPSLTAVVDEVRMDPATGLYHAALRVRTSSIETGRRVAVSFPGLASGIDVLSASGVDSNGVPMINVAPAIRSGGLDKFATSAPIELTISNPSRLPLHLQPVVYSAGSNAAPLVNDPGPLSVVVGGYLEADFSASDPDGDLVRYSVRSAGGLPIAKLTPAGRLTVTPAPGQAGVFAFDLVASDGFAKTIVPVSLTVTEDAVTSTRISGVVLNTLGEPLEGIPIELGGDSATTDAQGQFEVSVSPGSLADALFIRGEAYTGSEVYPFIAEKIPLLIGRDLYEGTANVIGRPIYLPALDVANGQTIDPNNDTTVTTPAIPGAAVFVASGTLKDQSGQPFSGILSITEVPAELTPAALPDGLYTDLVVTIQPGEMVFETPAPLTLPNRAGHAPGTEMILWSISPITGEFEQVGTGQVSVDGALIETITGGIRNSSWHDFSTTEPVGTPPKANDNNPEKDCDDCEKRHQPEQSGGDFNPIQSSSPKSLSQSSEQTSDPSNPSPPPPKRTNSFTLRPGDSNGFASWSAGGAASVDGTIREGLFAVSSASGNYIRNSLYSRSSADGSETIDSLFPPGRSAGGTGEPETPLSTEGDLPANSVSTHAGALHKSHPLVSYNSLGTGRGLTLVYDSERADPRPIVHAEVQDPGRNIDSPLLVSSLTVYGGAASSELREGSGNNLALPAIQTSEAYRSISPGLDAAGTVHQIDELAEYPSGRYGYTSTMRISGANSLTTSGLTTNLDAKLVHVNTIHSPFGSGWGIAGLQELIPNYDGSLLLIDGDGGESVFERVAGSDYYTAPGDFSRLYENGDGTFRRVLTDQTVYQFNSNHRLVSVTDRNGNTTSFEYDTTDRLLRIVDPVGLETRFEYSGERVSAIVDPINRRTEFQYDGEGNLTEITDPDSSTRLFGYDRDHRVISETNKNGDSQQIGYDFAGRVRSFMRTDGSTIRYAPAQSRAFVPPESTSNPNSAPPAVSLGRQAIAAVADANGNVTSTRLDRAGQTIAEADGAGALPSYVRSTDNRVTEMTDGRGNTTLRTYDDRGNTTSVSDPISRGNSNNSLFLNRVYLTGENPAQVITHDINGDGFIDALVSSEGSDTLFIHPGRGDGTFATATPISVPAVRSFVVTELNADGIDDIATANSNGSVSILLGLGDGTYSPASNLPASNLPNSIKAADFNGDDNIDLAVLSRGSNGVDIFLGNGDGTFAIPVNYAVSPAAVNLAYGDLDSDGNLDIVTASRSTGNHISVLRGAGDGTFFARVDLTIANEELLGVRLGDFDQDGNVDLLASDGDTAVWVAAGLGDLSFATATTHEFSYSAGGTPTQPSTSILDLADINSDGTLDFVAAQPLAGGFNAFLGDGNGDFVRSESVYVGGGFNSLTISDLNADENADVIAISEQGRFVSVRLGQGEGNFEAETEFPVRVTDFDVPPDSLQTADIDDDGLVDLIASSSVDDSISILRNDGFGGLSSPSTVFFNAAPTSLTLGDSDDDGNLDFLALQRSSNELQLLFGDGTTLGDYASITLATVDQPSGAEVADFNSDGIPDLVVAGEDEFNLLIGDGSRNFVATPAISLAAPPTQTVVGDFNDDGIADLVFGAVSSTETYISIHLGIGDGSFDSGSVYSVGGNGSSPLPLSDLLTFDANGDGTLDLVATDPSTQSLRVLIGGGDGSFTAPITTSVGMNPVDVSVIDINGDGVEDVVVAAADDGVANVLVGVGNGTFVDRQDYYLDVDPVGVAVIDVLDNGSPYIYSVGAGSTFMTVVPSVPDSSTAAGKAKRYEYDPQFSQLSRMVDELGNETLIDIDPANGNARSVTRVIGDVGGGDDLITTFTYTSRGQIDTATDPLGRITDYQYDTLGRLIATTFAVGTPDQATSMMEYDGAGNLTALIDELGHRTEYQFDVLNRLIGSTDADPDGSGPLLSQTRTYSYDDHGNAVSITDGLSASLTYQYDDEHRLIAKTDSAGETWNYVYDTAGNLSQVTDRLGRVTTYDYDDRNRLRSTVDPEGGVLRYLYDADDNPVRSFDKNGSVWVTEYDARNRTVREIDPLGHETKFQYDRADNLIASIDPLTRRTEYEYDDVYRLVTLREADPDGPSGPLQSPVYSFAYDAASNQTLRIDPLGNETSSQYDSRNRLVVQTLPDPDGSGPLASPVLQFTYDDANRLTEVLDPLSRVTTHTYDDLNRLIVTAYPDPDGEGPDNRPTITNSFDIAGNLIASTDPLGNTTTYSYDSLYRLISTTKPDPDGVGPLLAPVTTFHYDAEGQLTAVDDPLQRRVAYQYDLLGRVLSETYPDPDGSGPETNPVISHTYDPVGNRLSTIDPLGNVNRFEYDAEHRLVRLIATDPDGPAGPDANPITSFRYDSANQLLDTTDPLGRVTSQQYDDLGRVIQTTYPDPDGDGPLESPVLTHAFDAVGNLLATTDALGNTTDYLFDNLYRRTDVILADPDGPSGPQARPTTHIDYDIANRAVAATDPLGRRTELVYDDLDRIVREVYPDPDGGGPLASPQMTYAFDLVGNRLATTDAVGSTTNFEYDHLYRMTSRVQADPDGPSGPLTSPVTTYTYDVASQMLTVSDPLGRTVTSDYDQLGRVIRVTEPDPDAGGPLAAAVTTYEFDLVGNERSITDPLGLVTTFAYDDLYRRISQVSEDLDGTSGPLGNPTTFYSYDLVGNLLSLRDPIGNTTRWQYDNLNRNTVETITLDGSDVTRTYLYDAMSNLTRRSDRNDRVVQYDYDAIHRPISERWLDSSFNTSHTINTSYDEANQILTSDDLTTGSRYDYAYDSLGRVIGSTVNNGGSEVLFSNAYDSQSRRISQTATVGGNADYQNNYEFDALHRPNQIAQTAQAGGNTVTDKRFDFAYNAASQLVAIDRYTDLAGTSLVNSSRYEFDGQARLASLQHTDASASSLAGYSFTYDMASRITDIDSLVDGSSAYNYDNGNQLTAASHASQAGETYLYDENGNRTLSGYQTGDHNRLTSDGQFDYSYDNEGNRIRRTDLATGAVTDYSWDHRNRLVSITDRSAPSGPATQTVDHRYDPFNRWISSTTDGDGDGPATSSTTRYEYDGSNIVLQRDDAGEVTHRYSWGVMIDQIMAEEETATGEVLYPLADHLGTVRDVSDAAGSVVNHLQYDSYGNVESETDAAIETLFGYTGKPLDQATGLQNNHHRWYDAAVGRWTSEDPIGFAAGDSNLNRYANNQPTNMVDPTGQVVVFVHGILNRNRDEIGVLTDNLGGQGKNRQEVVHFIYGRGRDPESNNVYPHEPDSLDAFQHTNSVLNQAAGRELAVLVKMMQHDMKQSGSNEPIHIVGYSNGSNVVFEMAKRLNEPVDSTVILGGSIDKKKDFRQLASVTDNLYFFTSPGDGATKLVGGVGSQGLGEGYVDVPNVVEYIIPNVFHSASEASSSHPLLTVDSTTPVSGRVKPFSTGWLYDLIGFQNSFTYDENGNTDATFWLTKYLVDGYLSPLLGLGYGEDNRYSSTGRLPNGISLNKCDDQAVEYVFHYSF